MTERRVCLWTRCGRPVERGALFCSPHWRALPWRWQNGLRRHCAISAELDNLPTEECQIMLRRVAAWIAMHGQGCLGRHVRPKVVAARRRRICCSFCLDLGGTVEPCRGCGKVNFPREGAEHENV